MNNQISGISAAMRDTNKHSLRGGKLRCRLD